jgi:hypothetical protein
MNFASPVERLKREFCRPDALDLVAVLAADFRNGGCPGHACAFDRRGWLLATLDRHDGESLVDFRRRIRDEAQRLAGAARTVVGGWGGDRPPQQRAWASFPGAR